MKTTKNKDDQQLYEKGQGNGATLASPDLLQDLTSTGSQPGLIWFDLI